MREGDPDNFFSHENHPYPPALSSDGTLYSGNKSAMLDCLEDHGPSQSTAPDVEMAVLSGAAVVHMLNPKW